MKAVSMQSVKKILLATAVLSILVFLIGFQTCDRYGFRAADKNLSGKQSIFASTLAPSLAITQSGQKVSSNAESCDPGAGWICMNQPLIDQDTLIGAWYSLYFYKKGTSDPDHWAEWTQYEPELGYYDSGDIILKQYPYFKQAGINYLILDNTNGWDNDGGRIAGNAKKVFDQLPHDISIAIAGGFPLWNSAWNAAERVAHMSREADSLWSQFSQRPNYLKWYDGATNSYKPLFLVYNDIQNNHPKDEIRRYWADPRFTVRYSAGEVDNRNPLLNPYAKEGLWGWVILYPQIISAETMAVQAGHNTTHLPNRVAPPRYRRGGQSYIEQWLNVIKHKPKNIIIPSWNDWAEETAIEPARKVLGTKAEAFLDYYGEETPDWYVQITAAYAGLRKGLMPDTYYRTEDDPRVYKVENGKLVWQSALPHKKPVIFLPAGALRQFSPAISEGLFMIGANIYYSNGAAYCYFPSMASFTRSTGRTSATGIRSFAEIPAVMRNDGNCN